MNHYPLGEHQRDKIRTKTGKTLDDVTLENVMQGKISSEDIKISRDVLRMQGQVALQDKKPQMAANFERASELIEIPDEEILRFYNMLRPKRATKSELLEMADRLKSHYHAEKCGDLVLDASAVYEKRGLLL